MARIGLVAILAAAPLFAAKPLDIYFVDTDLGNCVMIVTPSGQAMMFDTGQAGEKYVNRILDAMKVAGVKQLESGKLIQALEGQIEGHRVDCPQSGRPLAGRRRR